MIARCCCVTVAGFRVPARKTPNHQATDQKGDSLPRHSSLGTGRTQNHRESTATPAGLARGSAPSSLLQGHPPSLRFGHPDVATEATETSTHPPNRCSYVFRKRPQGVTRTLSAAKQGGAERPGDGCPCVGAEETCGAHHQKQSRTQALQAQKLYFKGNAKIPPIPKNQRDFS